MRLSLVSLIGSLGVLSCAGATIYTPVSSTLTASVLVSGGQVKGVDVRGAADLQVSVNGTTLDDVTLADITGGTDPNGLVLAFGNNALGAFGVGGTATGPYASLKFDAANPTFLNNASIVLLLSSVSPYAGNVAADPGLSAFVNSNPLLFGFGYADTIRLGDVGSLNQYSLLAVQGANNTPEPGSVFLLVGGMTLLASRRLGIFRAK